MKKSILLFSLLTFCCIFNGQAQIYRDGFTNDFESPKAPYWGAAPAGLSISHLASSSTVKVIGDGTSGAYATISYGLYDNPQMNGLNSYTGSGDAIASVDMSASPYIYIVGSSTVNIPFTIQLKDINGYITTASESTVFVNTIGANKVYTFNYADAYDGGYGGSACTDKYFGCDLDFTQIVELEFQINPGTGKYNGTMVFDYIQIGGYAPYLPSVNILSPSYGASITTSPITLSAATSDDNGEDIDSVRYFEGTTLIGNSTSYDFTYDWINPTGGSHTIFAVAYNHLGIMKSSSNVTFTYTKTGCTTKPSFSTNTMNLTVEFLGSYFGGGTPKAYSWDFGDASAVVNTMNATHTYAKPGNYTVTYTITDECDKNITKLESVTVTSPTTGVSAAQSKIVSSNIYPNPATDIAHIAISLASVSDVKIIITDAAGKEIITAPQGVVSDVNYDISVASLNKGFYLVRYYINGEAAKSAGLIVQ